MPRINIQPDTSGSVMPQPVTTACRAGGGTPVRNHQTGPLLAVVPTEDDATCKPRLFTTARPVAGAISGSTRNRRPVSETVSPCRSCARSDAVARSKRANMSAMALCTRAEPASASKTAWAWASAASHASQSAGSETISMITPARPRRRRTVPIIERAASRLILALRPRQGPMLRPSREHH